ncbi:DNA repair protein rad50 [Botrytis cinerea]
MSKIEKMRICGVRSFDHKGWENISFNTPLTLIVGLNGSGKTTIIECLKYATTGAQPPNSKVGGAFIHDPKLCGEKEVLAQVKLSFQSTTGSRMVITRCMQLTVTKTARKMKTLDAGLMVNNGGERTAVSHKVGEIDKIMQTALGVSEAVLDNVIFCHQDDSLWPMSEPSQLKKKFDDIFEATKYTKAVDSLKSLKKDYAQQIKGMIADESIAKDNKDKGEKTKSRCEELSAQIDQLSEEALKDKANMEAVREVVDAKQAQAAEFWELVQKLRTNKERVKFSEENLESLQKRIKPLSESDEWLKSTLDQYADQSIGKYNRIGKKQADLGRQQALKQAYEEELESRIQLVKSAASKHAIRGYDDDINESRVNEFIERIRKLSRDKERELERAKTATNEELKNVQTTLTELQNQHAIRVQEKVTAKQTISNNERKVSPKQTELGFIQFDEGDKTGLEASHNETKDLLEKLRTQFDGAGWTVASVLAMDACRSNDRAQLDYVMEELKKTKGKLDTMKATHGAKLDSILGSDWQVDTLAKDFQRALDREKDEVSDATNEQEVAKKSHSEAGFRFNALREDLKAKKEQLKACENAVLNSIMIEDMKPLVSVEEYPRELNQLEEERDEVRDNIDGFKHKIEYFTQCLTTIQTKDMCKLCERGFAEEAHRSAAMKKIQKLLNKDARERLQGELEMYNEQLKTAKAAQSQYDIYQSLKDEIPNVEQEMKKAEDEKQRLLEEVEHHDSIVERKNARQRDVESLTHIISSIIRYYSDIMDHEAKIDSLASQQSIAGSIMTVDDIQERQTACSENMREVREQLSKISAEKDAAKDRINDVERDLSRKSQRLRDVIHGLAKKQALRKEIDELLESSTQQRETMNHADAELEILKPKIDTAKAKYEDIQQQGHTKEREVRTQKEKLADTVRQFLQHEKSINGYIDNGGPENLAACERAIKSIQQDQKRIGEEMNGITTDLNALRAKKSDSDRLKTNISDNILYRQELAKLEVYKKQTIDLESQNVEGNFQTLTKEAERIQATFYEHRRLYQQKTAILSEKDQNLAQYLQDWDLNYKNARSEYRTAMIKVKTTKAAIDDLGKMITAMDKAIVKFHSVKMEEINRIAGELWQTTYQGTDVDTIMIRSEKDEGETTAGNKKTNYKYRVVMVKQDVEMDMRGRCSAGQKVLACIIIRLALAECFGINCGLIALDEPTTNLDQDNIKALAQSLHDIIKSRQQQANFQLIIITHDEEFLKVMQCSDFCDDFYQVSRDQEQNSKIEKIPIAQVMEGN